MEACPSHADLHAFLLGDSSEMIGLHLRDCATCQSAVESFTDDAPLRRMAAALAATPLPHLDDSEISRLVDDLCRGGPTRVTGPWPQAFSPIVLGPPDRDGDLGTLGAFAIEAEIGRGGMGIVYRARDRSIGRIVALKVLRAELADESARSRFIQEMKHTARVEHDHLLRLYATSGPEDRVPYLVLEHISGPTLATRIRERPRVERREAAALIAQVADGLAAVHEAGLVHRDVKPSNILIDPATGRAKLGDFGVAKLLSGPGDALTREGEVAGTPAYLSPEQITRPAEVEPSSDLYSLGVSLYECLTGEPPFRGEPHGIVQQILKDEPRPPRASDPSTPRDLETICLKAMAKEPSRRYATARDLADDLRRFLKGEPIKARPAGPIERSWRWCRNNAKIAALTATALLLLVALAVGSTTAAVLISKERSKAVGEARRAEEQRGLALDAFSSLVSGIQDQLGTRPGTLGLRKTLLETARDGLGRVARQAGDDHADASLLTAFTKLGDVDLALGKTADARVQYDRALTMARRLVAADPKSVSLRRGLAAAYDCLGALARREYRLADEFEPYSQALAIREQLLAEAPNDPDRIRAVTLSLGKIGQFHEGSNHFDEARARYRQALDLLNKLPRGEGSALATSLSDERFYYGRLAALAIRESDSPAVAVEAARKSLDAAEKLHAIDPANSAWALELAQARQQMAKALIQTIDLDGAEREFIACVADRKSAVDADPADLAALRALGIAHQDLGDLAVTRQRDEAMPHYLKALALFDEVARRDPASVTAHKDRVIVRRKIEISEAAFGRYAEAERWADQELEVQNAPGVPPHPDHQGWIAEATAYRDVYKALPRAVRDPSSTKDLPTNIRPFARIVLSLILSRAGRCEEAAEIAREFVSTAPQYAARTFAIAALKAPEPMQAKYADESLAAIRASVAIDPTFVRSTGFDPEFARVRTLPGYPEVLNSARKSHP